MIVVGTMGEVVRAFLEAAAVAGMARVHSAPQLALALDLALALAGLALVAEAVVRACALLYLLPLCDPHCSCVLSIWCLCAQEVQASGAE